ncbi:MAG: prephenate dehydrogenase/arogenate dehydrogenase family protein [Pseudomonadota bacterium]
MINRLAIIGVGLIGGSLARALKEVDAVREIVGFGRSVGNLQLAIELGVIDRAAVNAADAVRDAELVVIAVPVGNSGEILRLMAPALAPDTIVTDVGSVKGSVIAAARRALGDRFPNFVPGHPLAGTEQSGVGASHAGLFRDRRVILTPEIDTRPAATAQVSALWKTAGADVVTMSAELHDRVLAASSHLPHVLAYTLVDMLVRHDDHKAVFDCAAGGFLDFTRIAASDPVMWRDICLANRAALAPLLRQYQGELDELIRAVDEGDGAWMLDIFTRAKHARDALNKKM